MIRISDCQDVPLYRRIVDAVRASLEAGRILPGEKLQARQVLARELGVNMVTVRHAYELLENEGIVVSRHGSGTFVRTDALQCLRRKSDGRRYESIVTVIGERDLADCGRITTFITQGVLAGVREVMGERAGRFEYAESCNQACLGHLGADSAVLLKEPRQVDSAMVRTLQERGIPVIVFWTNLWDEPETANLLKVHYDLMQAPALACRHLIDCGYRRIGFIGYKATHDATHGKFFQFTNTMHEAGLDIIARHIRELPPSAPGAAYRAAWDIVQQGNPPEAMMVDSDYNAMEVIRALHDAGLKVPDDVGVIGYDDLPEAARFDPPLTTVRTPRRDIGRRLGELLTHWRDDALPSGREQLLSKLVVRESTRILAETVEERETASAAV